MRLNQLLLLLIGKICIMDSTVLLALHAFTQEQFWRVVITSEQRDYSLQLS